MMKAFADFTVFVFTFVFRLIWKFGVDRLCPVSLFIIFRHIISSRFITLRRTFVHVTQISNCKFDIQFFSFLTTLGELRLRRSNYFVSVKIFFGVTALESLVRCNEDTKTVKEAQYTVEFFVSFFLQTFKAFSNFSWAA